MPLLVPSRRVWFLVAVLALTAAGALSFPPAIVGGGSAGARAADAGPLEARSTEPTIRVRTGEHPGYSRIVFDWTGPVGYRLIHGGREVTVEFDRSARFDFAKLGRRPARTIARAEARSTETGVAVVLAVAEGAQVRDLRAGYKIVVDVFARADPPAAGPEAAGLGRPFGEGPAAGEAELTAEVASGGPEAPTVRVVPPLAAAAPLSLLPGRPGVPGVDSDREAEKAGRAEAPPERPSVPATVASRSAATAAATLRFDWSEPVAAAVFRRVGYLWVVFDAGARHDLASLRAAAADVITGIEQLPVERATVLRLVTRGAVSPGLRRDGLAWLIDFGRQPLAPTSPLEPTIETEGPGTTRIAVPIAEPGEPISFTDPEVGDRIVVVPVVPLGHGIGRGYDYPEVRLLATAQGVAIVPRIDDLVVRSLKSGIELASTKGLELSPVPAEVRQRARLERRSEAARVLDLGRWREATPQAIRAERRRLLLAAAGAAEGEEREAHRLALAELSLAQGDAAEALGVLTVVAGDRPAVDGDPRFRLLRGAALMLLGRLPEARGDLFHGSLGDSDEGALWQAALSIAEGGGSIGSALKRGGTVAQDYPRVLRIPLGLLVAEGAIADGDVAEARRHLDVLRIEPLDRRLSGRLEFLEGRLLEASGEFDLAVDRWKESERGHDRPSRARSALARVALEVERDRILRTEAIEQLESLRYAWRGDAFEFQLLSRLGELYLAEGDYPRALRTLRQAVTVFPDQPGVQAITEQMAGTFQRLYLDGLADSLAPLAAIALFDEFRELTPAGDKGNEMIRKLADRLVAVDLLGRAASLLEDQVRHRLDGEDKARVGARLALVNLLDRKPEAALAALAMSAVETLPEALARQRAHLEARSLAETGRSDDALALLEADASLDAELIRADIHWRTRDWPAAAQALNRVARLTGALPGHSLDEAQARYLLNRAVALTLGGDGRALKRLSERYGQAMNATSYRDAFRLIADAGPKSLTDLNRAVTSRVEDAENFQTFLAAYQDRVRKGGLSAIN